MNLSYEELIKILEIARFAPSINNTQPWRVSTLNSTIRVDIDKEHKLIDGDPTGRETIISLGIFCEALIIACSATGKRVESIQIQTDGAELKLSDETIDADGGNLPFLLKQRATDNSTYKPVEVTDSMIAEFKNAAADLEVTVEVTKARPIIDKVADLSSKGVAVSFSSPSFRKELSRYLAVPGSGKKRGINVKSLDMPGFLTWAAPWLVRSGIIRSQVRDAEKKHWQSASALIMITAPGDLHKYWLDTGRAYLRVSLLAEQYGLSQATSAAVVEASNYHEDIEAMLGTRLRILAVMRVGKGAKHRHHSPRVDAQDLAT